MVQPSAQAPFTRESLTESRAHEESEHGRTAGFWALRIAGAWLAVLAVLLCGGALLVAWFTLHPFLGSDPGDLGSWLTAALTLSLFGACSVTARVSWRAAAPHHPLAGTIAFTIGALALLVLLVPPVALLLPPNGLYGLDVDAVRSAARLPWSLAVLVPAALMLFGTVRRWCVAGGTAVVRRRTRIAAATTIALFASIGALVVVDAAQPACGPGRTCVPSARISLVLPGGWSRTAPESGELYAATAGSDHRRFVIQDGSQMLREAGLPVPTDIDGVAARVPALFEDGGGPFSSITGVLARRAELPVGTAARVSYTSTTSFILIYNQTTITEWVFINGRLIVLEYMVAYGEGTPVSTASDPPDCTLLLDSLRAL